MKAILISIQPKWAAKILNGEKTIEIRKTMPKCDLPIDVYIYCTKDSKHKLEYCDINEGCWSANDGGDYYNGKVVAKFTLNKVEEIKVGVFTKMNNLGFPTKWITKDTNSLTNSQLLDLSCLTNEQLNNYLDTIWFSGKQHICGYAWHIDNLVVFDKPMELNQFEHEVKIRDNVRGYIYDIKPLTKAPQSWCYVEVDE